MVTDRPAGRESDQHQHHQLIKSRKQKSDGSASQLAASRVNIWKCGKASACERAKLGDDFCYYYTYPSREQLAIYALKSHAHSA
jgi:hypothetical protein